MSRQATNGYRSIADTLRHQIADGTYSPGGKLPGEVNLGKTYEVNRHTIRAALAELEQEGLIYKIQGKGTFVSLRKIPYSISPGTSFSGTLEKLGLQGQPTLLDARTLPCPENLMDLLDCKPGAEVHQLEILRRIEGFPVCLTTSWLPASRFPDLLDHLHRFRSLYGILKRIYNKEGIQRAWSRIEAGLPEPREQDALQLSPQVPILITRSLATDEEGLPIEVSHSRCRSDAYTLHVNFPL